MIFFNIIAGIIVLIALTIFFILWLKAEKKLAKYGKSTIYKNRDKD